MAARAQGAPATARVSPAAASTVKIPFVVGLTTVNAVSEKAGDCEILNVITAIDASGYRVVRSADLPQTKGSAPDPITVSRKVLAVDQAKARRTLSYFNASDPDSFPGTVVHFSAVMVHDLRTTGKTAITEIDTRDLRGTPTSKGKDPGTMGGLSAANLNDLLTGKAALNDVVGQALTGSPTIRDEYSGTLVRVVDPTPTLSVLVNGRNTPLPVLHVKGTLTGSKGQRQVEYLVLDDPSNPILLRSNLVHPDLRSGTTTVLRIEYPQPKEAPSSIESSLAKSKVAEVYGIYFSFNRADIRPESERILKEIADVLTAHPDWKLQVDGHTDGIGNDAENLNLSKRRSAAVKTALVTRYGIDSSRLSTGGYGESAPQATNDTPEGRARNRRVELRRL